VAVLLSATTAFGGTFHVDDPAGRNTVTFKSEAPLEDIIGTSNAIAGYLVFDPEKPKSGGHGELTVPVASLNTGIPLRDEHLRGADWLNAEQYPNIVLIITEVRNVMPVKSSDDFQTYEVTAVGQFSLKGKTAQVEAPGRITYMKESEKTKARLPGDLLAARASFELALADFGVTGPAGMDIIGSKVGETITVDVSLVANTQESKEEHAEKQHEHGDEKSGGM
jgi:polyisoprenoid-binding protein YceI